MDRVTFALMPRRRIWLPALYFVVWVLIGAGCSSAGSAKGEASSSSSGGSATATISPIREIQAGALATTQNANRPAVLPIDQPARQESVRAESTTHDPVGVVENTENVHDLPLLSSQPDSNKNSSPQPAQEFTIEPRCCIRPSCCTSNNIQEIESQEPYAELSKEFDSGSVPGEAEPPLAAATPSLSPEQALRSKPIASTAPTTAAPRLRYRPWVPRRGGQSSSSAKLHSEFPKAFKDTYLSPHRPERELAFGSMRMPQESAAPDGPSDQSSRIQASLKEIDTLIRNLPLGNIAFNVPDKMDLDETTELDLALSLASAAEDLKKSVASPHIKGLIESAAIRVTDRMEARLTGNGFQITAVTPELQVVVRSEPTTWKWLIKAAHPGVQELHLTVSALIEINKSTTPFVSRTFEKTIRVEVSWQKKIAGFAQDNWQWVWTAIAAPIGAWFLSRYRRARFSGRDIDD